MNSKWQKKTIMDCAHQDSYSTQIGPFGKALMSREYTESGVPVLRGVNVNKGRFHDDDFVFISEEKANDLDKFKSEPGDILLVHKGTLGKIGIMPKSRKYNKYILGNSMMKVKCDPSKLLPDYLYYWLCSKEGQDYIFSRVSQVGVPQIQRPLSTLREAELALPDIDYQKKTISILTAIDEKIENCESIASVLERLGKLMFKSWFVQFDPTRAKKLAIEANLSKESVMNSALAVITGLCSPEQFVEDQKTVESLLKTKLSEFDKKLVQNLQEIASLFPDDFEQTDQGNIPKGWSLETLNEHIKVKHGFAFKGEYFQETQTVNILLTPGNFKVGGGFKFDKLKFYDGPIPEEYILSKDDLLLTMTDLSKQSDTLGFPALVPSSKEKVFLHNQRLGKVIFKDDKEKYKFYFYHMFTTDDYRQFIVGSATGSTVKHTSPTRIESFKFPFSEDLAEKYSVLQSDLFEMIDLKNLEISRLSKMRDTTLPALLNGTIDLSQISIESPEDGI